MASSYLASLSCKSVPFNVVIQKNNLLSHESLVVTVFWKNSRRSTHITFDIELLVTHQLKEIPLFFSTLQFIQDLALKQSQLVVICTGIEISTFQALNKSKFRCVPRTRICVMQQQVAFQVFRAILFIKNEKGFLLLLLPALSII